MLSLVLRLRLVLVLVSGGLTRAPPDRQTGASSEIRTNAREEPAHCLPPVLQRAGGRPTRKKQSGSSDNLATLASAQAAPLSVGSQSKREVGLVQIWPPARGAPHAAHTRFSRPPIILISGRQTAARKQAPQTVCGLCVDSLRPLDARWTPPLG